MTDKLGDKEIERRREAAQEKRPATPPTPHPSKANPTRPATKAQIARLKMVDKTVIKRMRKR